MVTKSFIIAAMLLLFAGAALAADGPLDKGSWMLDGRAFFRSQSGDLWENRDGDGLTSYGVGNGALGLTETFEVGNTVGFFISPGLMIGGQFSFLGFSQGDISISGFGIGPALTYYMNTDHTRAEAKGAVYPFFGAFFTYGSLSNEDDKIADMFQYGGRGGIMYMLSNAVGLDFGGKLQSDSWEFNGASERITGLTLEFGVGVSAFIY